MMIDSILNHPWILLASLIFMAFVITGFLIAADTVRSDKDWDEYTAEWESNVVKRRNEKLEKLRRRAPRCYAPGKEYQR
jgi:hypothetical protein